MQAQYRAPIPERKTARAISVLETHKNGSRWLVPVVFYYEGHFYDATLYHATPVPLSLYADTLYEVQQSGKPVATFTVQTASQVNDLEWYGNGRFKSLPAPSTLAKKDVLKPVVAKDPSRPTLLRREGSEGDNTPAGRAVATAKAENDPNRPILRKKDAAGGSPGAPARLDGQIPVANPLAEKDSTKPQALTTAIAAKVTEEASGEAPDHPILRRGKPAQEQSVRDLPVLRPDFAKKNEDQITRQIAISDAEPSDAQPLLFICPEEERRQMETAARELARSELIRMAARRGIEPLAKQKLLKAGGKPARGHSSTQKIAFEDEQFVPYDLGYDNYATVVFSGRYAPEAKGMGGVHKSWVVIVVARQDPEGKMIKLYSSVSDPRELDLYPEVHLVDALDPDGSGRVAFLFRERKRDGVSWLLGRLSGHDLQTIFETPPR